VHVHLEDDAGRNVFFRDEENFSPLLLNAIGGLLALLNPCMPIFAPTQESYKRFAKNSNAPTTISWGTNNRTVAIRLPTKPMHHKHLEHRVAGSDADVAKVIAAILAGIHYGLTHQCDPGEPIYGDASLPQYNQLLIANNLLQALHYRQENTAIKSYLADS
jgi:glutamine synthetase